MLRGWFTLYYQPEKQPKWDSIRTELMNRSNPAGQAAALEQLVLLGYSESIPPHLLMPVIQYTATTTDHRVIKLLLLFLETIETRDSRNEIRPEYILITDAIRKLLLSPNEYVRCSALRFLYKMNDVDILQQLLPPILQNLEHKDESVRWHASLLVGRLSRDIKGFSLDVSDSIIESYAREAEQRTLSSMLTASFEANPKDTLDMTLNSTQIFSNDMKQSILHIAPRAYHSFPQFRVQILETIVSFCEDDLISVRLQAANVLRKLSASPAAIRTTASTYCNLLEVINDENQRAFVVQALIEMISSHRDVLAPLSLEMSQGVNISGPLRTRLLNELVMMVQKESSTAIVPLITSKDKDSLEALRILLLRYPDTSTVISEMIGPYISDPSADIAEPASLLLKDCGIAGAKKEAYKYFSSSLEISTVGSVIARILWGIGEFADDPTSAAEMLADITKAERIILSGTVTIVNEDGTYGTKQQQVNGKTLPRAIQEGDSFLGLALVSSLIKLKLRGAKITHLDEIIKAAIGFNGAEKNAKDICQLWVKASENPKLLRLLRESTSESFRKRSESLSDIQNGTKKVSIIPATSPLHFDVLFNTAESAPVLESPAIVLPVIQLTGPSDSLYIEASCTIRKFDRVYHITLYNRTETTLTNILFEFTSVGSVSIIQRNDIMSIAKNEKISFDLPVMISSGSCGTLFGAVSFDFAGERWSDHQLLPLAPIDIDPFHCFDPTMISEAAFRNKWSESVWERKVDINFVGTDLISYLERIANQYKFAIITPRNQIEVTSQSAGFIAANLFSKSLFDEEVEMNISAKIEKGEKIVGFIRIRSQDMDLAFLFGKLIQ